MSAYVVAARNTILMAVSAMQVGSSRLIVLVIQCWPIYCNMVSRFRCFEGGEKAGIRGSKPQELRLAASQGRVPLYGS